MMPEQKWMNRLKRCLKDMPEGNILRVSSLYKNVAEIALFEEDDYNAYQETVDDEMSNNVSSDLNNIAFQSQNVDTSSECI